MSESENSEEVVKPKRRAPRKRVAKTAATKATARPRSAVAKKTSTRRAPATVKTQRVSSAPATNAEATQSAPRKAPTVFAAEKNKQKQRRTQLAVVGLILFVGVGSSAAIGYTDRGQIDVAQVVEERNQRARDGGTDEAGNPVNRVEVPVQNTSKAANGGLVGLGTGSKPKPKPVADTATSTASSTEQTASSTTAVASSTSLTDEQASSTDESTTAPGDSQPSDTSVDTGQ